MGWYADSLGNLDQALNAGLDPDRALSFLADLRDTRQARRDARRDRRMAALDAQQQMQGDISQLAVTESQQGTTLPQLAALASGTVGQLISPEQLYQMPGISSLYLPMGQEGYAGNAGQSRLMGALDPDVQADIVTEIRNGASTEKIYSDLQNFYGPAVFARLRPEIDKFLEDTVKTQPQTQALRGF